MIRALAVLLLAISFAVSPALALSVTQRVAARAPITTNIWVSSSGSDTNNNCRVPKSPCATQAHVNSLKLPAHTNIYLNGSFSSGDALALTTTNSKGWLNVLDYGASGATVNSGNSTAGFSAINLTGISVIKRNALNFTGGGIATNSTDGIIISNTQSGNTKLYGPNIRGTTVSAYGGNGILVKGTVGFGGFNNTRIIGNTVHDVTGQVTSNTGFLGGTSCINIYNYAGFAGGQSNISPSLINFVILNNTAFNCTGVAGASSWTGSGITYFQAYNGLVHGNVVHDYGANVNFGGGGAGGIWGGDMDSVVVQFNEVYNGSHGGGGSDGGPYDLDEGSTNSVIQYNWGHDNTGNCILLDANVDGSLTTWANNTIRWNICQNNGFGVTSNAELNIAANGGNMTGNTYVYNNTFYPPKGGNAVFRSGTNSAAVTVSNNIFYAEQSGDTIIQIPNPSTISFVNNDYFVPFQGGTGNLSYSWNGTSYSTFAAWQTATGQEKISGVNVGLTNNPKIYVPGGGFTTGGYSAQQMMAYNLQSSSTMGSAGLNLTTQFGISPGTTDFYGNAVTASTMPVGAAKSDISAFAASCAASTNFLARVSSFANLDNVAYNSFLCGLNSDGILSAMDILYWTAAPNSAASLLNLLSTSFSLTTHATVTFTAGVGYLGNGTSGYLDTNWTPSANGVNFTLNSGSHSGCLTVSGLSNLKADYGVQNLAHTAETSFYTGSGGEFGDVNDFTGAFDAATTNSNGIPMIIRQGAQLNMWMDGFNNSAPAPASTALPDQHVTLLANNKSAGPTDFKAQNIACVMFGSGNIDALTWYRRSQSMMQAYGISQY